MCACVCAEDYKSGELGDKCPKATSTASASTVEAMIDRKESDYLAEFNRHVALTPAIGKLVARILQNETERRADSLRN